MLPGILLSFREGLEAALVVGILMGILKKLNHTDRAPAIWLGTAAAALVSALLAVGLVLAGMELEGKSEALFEGFTVLLAAVMLTWMIFWMQRQGKSMRAGLEAQTRHAISRGQGGALFLVAFVAVVREGIELALFLTAAAMASSANQAWAGGLLGLVLAAMLGWGIFASTLRLDLRRFFQVTGIILLLFAAGLVARGAHEFVQVGWVPALVGQVWNTGALLSDHSLLGQLASSLLGYQSSPSLAEVLAYVCYLVIVACALWLANREPSRPAIDIKRTV